jgi:hypothetical protein
MTKARTNADNVTADIAGITAGTGITGGGTSGTVTVTNSMATAFDTKGDLIAATGSDAFSKLAVGANDTVLTAASGEDTGLKWAAVAGGYSTYEVFTSSTTWTVPTGITKCAVYGVAGGGGGASGSIVVTNTPSSGGGGGAGGGIAFDPFYLVTPGASITVTIGAGGAGRAGVASVSTQTEGNVGLVGNASSFDGNTIVTGNVMVNHAGGAPANTTLSGLINSRIGGAGGGNTSSADYTTIKSLLNTAGSTGADGVAAPAGTTKGTIGASLTPGFAGGGGGGGRSINSTSTSAGGAGVAGGGSGGAGATSNSNITTTAGAGGAGAANSGGGGGGGGGAGKIGTTSTSVTSGAGGNGGSGIIIVFY